MSIRNLQDGPLPLGMLRIEREKKIYIKILFDKTKTSRRSDTAWYISFKTGKVTISSLLSLAIRMSKSRTKNKEYSESGTVFERRKNRFLQRWETKTSRRSGAAWYMFLNPRRWQFAVYFYLTNSNKQIKNKN